VNARQPSPGAQFRALIEAAIKRSGVTFPRTRSTRMVTESMSKKPKPRRAGRA